MSESGQDVLIARLAADLRPRRPLAPIWQRAALWFAAVLWIGLLLSLFADWPALRIRLMAAPDMWISPLGAVLTAILAGIAALQVAIPGRSAAWALLPLPALALWVGASTAGCLRLLPVAATRPEPAMHAMVCLQFLLLVSLPLSLLLTWLLLRAYPLRPGLTATLAGLASAGAAAALLTLIHPFDATADDLAMHAWPSPSSSPLPAWRAGGRCAWLHLPPGGSQTGSERFGQVVQRRARLDRHHHFHRHARPQPPQQRAGFVICQKRDFHRVIRASAARIGDAVGGDHVHPPVHRLRLTRVEAGGDHACRLAGCQMLDILRPDFRHRHDAPGFRHDLQDRLAGFDHAAAGEGLQIHHAAGHRRADIQPRQKVPVCDQPGHHVVDAQLRLTQFMRGIAIGSRAQAQFLGFQLGCLGRVARHVGLQLACLPAQAFDRP